MEARLVPELPKAGRWQFEPKWDGFRCLAFKKNGRVELIAKSGKPLTRYFPEVAAALAAFEPARFVLDGELLVPEGRHLSFDALQARLHPAASRIAKLSRQTPALYMLFDLLMDADGTSFLARPLVERRGALEAFFAEARGGATLRLSPMSRRPADAKAWLARAGRGALDGVIAKPLDEPYRLGERAMLKVKCLRTADCVVGGFRYETGGDRVGSLLLGLYDGQGRLDHVGFTSAIADDEREALTRKLEKLRGGPGFTGDAPGGPSRWSTARSSEWVPLKPKLVAEVRYDQVTANRFRHGTKFLRWRPDKAPAQCTFDQLVREARPAELVRRALS
ncbi:MAG: ATP-dependent DNA ligase [Alphaproteobacteria bacterium]|nr:ATP-dependent DNA ligase [Alphaproteobacteria bacterium]